MNRTGILRTASVSKSKAKCKVCRVNPVARPGAVVCGIECAVTWQSRVMEKAARITAKKQAAADRAKLETLRPRKWWLAKAKTALHAYIRARDEGKSCISCDTVLIKNGALGGDYDAGHFRSVGSAKHMEFVEANIHGQCKYCNNHLGGNSTGYRLGLISRYSLPFVESIETDNRERKLTIADFQWIEASSKTKLKELQTVKQKP